MILWWQQSHHLTAVVSAPTPAPSLPSASLKGLGVEPMASPLLQCHCGVKHCEGHLQAHKDATG